MTDRRPWRDKARYEIIAKQVISRTTLTAFMSRPQLAISCNRESDTEANAILVLNKGR